MSGRWNRRWRRSAVRNPVSVETRTLRTSWTEVPSDDVTADFRRTIRRQLSGSRSCPRSISFCSSSKTSKTRPRESCAIRPPRTSTVDEWPNCTSLRSRPVRVFHVAFASVNNPRIVPIGACFMMTFLQGIFSIAFKKVYSCCCGIFWAKPYHLFL